MGSRMTKKRKYEEQINDRNNQYKYKKILLSDEEKRKIIEMKANYINNELDKHNMC